MSKAKKRILFVDDEQEQLDALKARLHSMRKEWETFFISSGSEALELLEREYFDLVVADLRMPDISGEVVLSQVKKKQPGAIRFILSGYSDANEIMKSVKDAHQFLSKPCSAEDLVGAIKRSLNLKKVLLNENAARAITSISELPTLPDLYLRLEQELCSEDASVNRVGELISGDMGMTASILKLVNSSFFGLYSKVTSPAKAVTLLGLDTVKGLVLGIHLFNSMPDEEVDFSIQALGEHCQFTGLLAREIVNLESGGREMAEQAFLAGFLHDVGKLVLASSFSAEYTEVLKTVREINVPTRTAESEILGFTHAEVGAYLLALWGFDVPVVEAVYAHHSPFKLESYDFSPGVAVHVSNSFEHELHVRNQNYAPHILDAQWLEEGGFSVKLPQWLECCAMKVEEDSE